MRIVSIFHVLVLFCKYTTRGALDDDSEPQLDVVKFITADGEGTLVQRKVWKQMGSVINTCLGLNPELDATMSLPRINQREFGKVLEFAEMEASKSLYELEEEKGKRIGIDIQPSEWQERFLYSLTQEQLLSLTQAADYLDMPKLLDLLLEGIAALYRGKSVKQLRKEFNIDENEEPYTEEEWNNTEIGAWPQHSEI